MPWRLALAVAALVVLTACNSSHDRITNNTVYITVGDTRCFNIILPDGTDVSASNVTVNSNGTVSIGNKAFTLNQDCSANPVTTTTTSK